MNKKLSYYLLSFLLIGIVIYLYFLKWMNVSFHDDDLYVLKQYSETKGFWAKVNMATSTGIFRPFQGFSIYFLIETFRNNFLLYYLYNILIQTINTLLFARIINLFLKSPYLSLFISLILGLSRYCYYNIVQLYGGGALEGLALIFFLLFLYSILKILTNDITAVQKKNGLLFGILYANLCMYTHERYTVLLPFIILVVLCIPSLRSITFRKRLVIIVVAVASIILPILIKKYYFSMLLFMGSGYTSISFSFDSILSFLISSCLSIFQINTGPEYVSGIPHTSLSLFNKLVVYILAFGMLLILIRYVCNVWKTFRLRYLVFIRVKESKIRKAFVAKGVNFRNRYFIFLSLLVLFFMLLAPAVIQVRVELRWLEAPLVTFILMIVLAITEFKQMNNTVRNVLYISLTMLFLWSNYIYLNQGAKNLYFSTAGTIGKTFDKAVKNNIIRRNNSKLYIWQKHRIPEREGEINWALAYGYFFNQYNDKSTQIIFVASTYQKTDSNFAYSFPNFNKDSDQVIFLKIITDDQTFQYFIKDITPDYLKDSLKTFKE